MVKSQTDLVCNSRTGGGVCMNAEEKGCEERKGLNGENRYHIIAMLSSFIFNLVSYRRMAQFEFASSALLDFAFSF